MHEVAVTPPSQTEPMSFDELLDRSSEAATTGRALRSVPTADASGPLTLLPPAGASAVDWVLDSHTKQVGRLGVAAVREVLAHARPPDASDDVAA